MKKCFSIAVIFILMIAFFACQEDNVSPGAPTITAPDVTNAQVSTESDVTFDLTVPGGFASYEVNATGGTATKKSEPERGATSGEVVVTFAGDATPGAGSVTIAVTDKNNKTETGTVVINKTQLPVPDVVVVSGLIDADQTWTSDNIYELAGRVIVKPEVTLTIEAGTIVKGREGSGISASALMIPRGAKLNAIGTAEAPIIMTSVLDNIMPGEAAGTTLSEADKGKWGGLVVLG